MPDLYLPGAERHDLTSGAMAGDGGARTIWHITWDRNATAAAPADLLPFDSLASYFAGGGAGVAPHVLWDPFTGRVAQFHPANQFSKSVVNAPGGVETNRKGNVCIQIESLFFPYCRFDGKVYPTLRDTPLVGLDGIVEWLRSWGVPDVWPMGAPDWNSHRNAAIWNSASGHYGHSQVPENDHTDPGPMPDLFGVAPAPAPSPVPAPKPPALLKPYPGYVMGYAPQHYDPNVKAYQQRMRDRGWSGIGVADGYFGNKTQAITLEFQREKFPGQPKEQDSLVGHDTWTAAFRTDNLT
jgi:hypothetical protein